MPSVIIRKKFIFEFGVGLCVLIAIAVYSYINLITLNKSVSWVRHTYIVKENLKSVENFILSAESNQRGFLLTDKVTYLADFNLSIERLTSTQSYLAWLVEDSNTQTERVKALNGSIDERVKLLRMVAALKDKGYDSQVKVIIDSNKGKVLMDEVLNRIEAIRLVEDRLLEERIQKQESSFESACIIIVFGGVISVVIVFGAVTLINNIQSPSSYK